MKPRLDVGTALASPQIILACVLLASAVVLSWLRTPVISPDYAKYAPCRGAGVCNDVMTRAGFWFAGTVGNARTWIASARNQVRCALKSVLTARSLRARLTSGQFPKPYPNGWYRVCGSGELPAGRVMAITCCGREMVAFRGEDGRAAVLDAFCPHLGTHLGHGGTVSGNNIVCPYHSWEFDADGTNKCIPYCSKDMSKSTRVNAKAYSIRERLDIVFVWYHASNEPPEYELTILDEVEDPEYRHIISEHVGDWGVHVMEPSHNSADWYHFHTVHQWFCQNPGDRFKFMFIEHGCSVTYGTSGDGDGNKATEKMPDTVYNLKMETLKLKLFGWFQLPKFFNSTLNTMVKVQGPQTQMIWYCLLPLLPSENVNCRCF
jgi:nitrite reductase/ring-hydroxylating ferredoxin subunit